MNDPLTGDTYITILTDLDGRQVEIIAPDGVFPARLVIVQRGAGLPTRRLATSPLSKEHCRQLAAGFLRAAGIATGI